MPSPPQIRQQSWQEAMNDMNTLILSDSDSDLRRAAEILKNGGLCAMPTETVYGLAGNALDSGAAAKIYAAKGRPSDNPLIVHISELSRIHDLVTAFPDTAEKIFKAFSPGPVTVILPRSHKIPDATSGGLDTVGIRLPADKRARKLISLCGFPLAAPSANLSGSPSPTSAEHCIRDLMGRVDCIIDGGKCAVGVESTVLSVDRDGDVTVLRPGFVTYNDLASLLGEEHVRLARGITERVDEGEKVLSPGMKYRHYAPAADIAIIDGSREQFECFVNSRRDEGAFALIFGDENVLLPAVKMGLTSEEQAHLLFDVLRHLDDIGAKRVYARCPRKTGVGLAVYNRLLRAAGFEVIKL